METDYKSEQSTHDSTINEMEKRVVDLRANVDRLQQMKQKLDDERISLVKSNEQFQLQVKSSLCSFSRVCLASRINQ